MRHSLAVLCLLGMFTVANAQEKDITHERTVTKTIKSDVDLTSDLWQMEDAVPVATGKVDLRFNYRWITANNPASRGDSSDDHIVTPSLYWGTCENVELSFSVPSWVGDAGEIPPGRDGNYDTYVGVLWRLMEQRGYWPALALSGKARIPTGDHSEGVDGELRLVLTNEYDSGIRSHFNAWAKTANGDNDPGNRDRFPFGGLFGDSDHIYGGTRDFQYGAVIGADGPLCDSGAVRWVADYQWRISEHDGGSATNTLEAGWEWTIDERNKVGMSGLAGLDDNDDTPNFGAAFNYSYAIAN